MTQLPNRYNVALTLTDAECEAIAAAVAAAPKALYWRDLALGAVFHFDIPADRYVRAEDGFQSLQTGETWVGLRADVFSRYTVIKVSDTLTWPQLADGLYFEFLTPPFGYNPRCFRRKSAGHYYTFIDPTGCAAIGGYADLPIRIVPTPQAQTASHNTVVTAPGAAVADKAYIIPTVGTIYLDVERVRQAIADADQLRCPFVTLAPDGAMYGAEGNTVVKDLTFRVTPRRDA